MKAKGPGEGAGSATLTAPYDATGAYVGNDELVKRVIGVEGEAEVSIAELAAAPLTADVTPAAGLKVTVFVAVGIAVGVNTSKRNFFLASAVTTANSVPVAASTRWTALPAAALDLAHRGGQTVLLFIGRELFQDQRRGDHLVPHGGHDLMDVIPVAPDEIFIKPLPEERGELPISGAGLGSGSSKAGAAKPAAKKRSKS